MYIQMLSEAIAEERGEKPQKPEEECLIDLQVEAHIPEEYIESIPQRLSIYRRIADIRTPDDVEDVYDELIDRFGDPPPSVQGLVNVSLLRNSASGRASTKSASADSFSTAATCPIYNIYNPLLFFLVLCLYMSTCLLAADKLIPLFHHIASTFRAFLC